MYLTAFLDRSLTKYYRLKLACENALAPNAGIENVTGLGKSRSSKKPINSCIKTA
jgi:hypothetical protein